MSYAMVRSPDGLDEILHTSINVAVWQRSLSGPLASWLQRVAGAQSFATQTVLDARAPRWEPLLAPLPESAQRAELHRDLRLLFERFVGLTNADAVRASFSVVTTNSCGKFHMDYVGLRLLCTYAGPGTEWVPEHAVNRAAMDQPWEDVTVINRAIVPDARRVRRTRPGHVLLLKGAKFPGNAALGAVHRSAPIEHQGARRIVLVFNEA
ncbi:DUF1826 domain-containing protein [Pendulispora rubella]|uniref:DUF1826 domain-containing protein n=1 Tax=Pendulispora rubella TaxID=2741070 RepID=A0ABZ2L1Z1_9BACT